MRKATAKSPEKSAEQQYRNRHKHQTIQGKISVSWRIQVGWSENKELQEWEMEKKARTKMLRYFVFV